MRGVLHDGGSKMLRGSGHGPGNLIPVTLAPWVISLYSILVCGFMAGIQRIGLDEVVRHFEELEDPRSTVNRHHPLVSVVVIALMAVLAGASGPTVIARWAALKQEFLLKALNLPNGVPRKDVFRRVLAALQPAAVQACFANWLQV